MTSLDGIALLHMSGTRAVFELEEGSELGEETIAAAFESRGMELESYELIERPRAKAEYLVDAPVT